MARRESPVELQRIIIPQIDAADRSCRIQMDQWSGQCEGPLQCFKFGGAVAPFRCIGLGIGVSGYDGKNQWGINGIYVNESPVQQVFCQFNVMFFGHPGMRT